MRNIYDIISEQKALVDINIATYDLNYATSYLIESREDYYIQEGIGEGIKNAANKVVEFIKNIIRKISELFKKVMNWLFGKKDSKAKLNKKIQDINEGKTTEENNEKDNNENDKEDWKNLSREEVLERRRLRKLKEKHDKNRGKPIIIGGETPQEKKARKQAAIDKEKNNRKEIKAAYKKLDDIEEVMKACKGKVKMSTFYKLSDLEKIGNNFYDEVPRAIDNVKNGKDFKYELIRNTFSRREHSEGDSMKDYIAAELVIGMTEHTSYISIFTDKVMEYLDGSEKIKSYLETQEKNTIDKLNKLMRTAQSTNNNEVLNGAQKLASMVSEFTQALLRPLIDSRNAADAIANKAVEMYKEQVRALRK